MFRITQGRSGLAVAFAIGTVIAVAGTATASRLITGKQIKLDTAHSKNITSSSKVPALSSYCVKPSVPVNHVIATLDFNNGEISASCTDNFTSCDGGDAIIRTFTSGGSDANPGAGAFWVLFN